jgi:hypothetical protein
VTLACLVIVGTLCVPYFDGAVIVERNSMVGSVEIQTDNWRVGQELNSDCPTCEPDKAKFISICANDECVSYFRRCDDAVHPTVCEYFFDKYPPVDVTAKTESDFQQAITSVGLILSKARSGNFLLSAFSKEGPGPYTGYATPPTNYMRSPAPEEGTK